jgi:hypothetical protein
MVLAPSLFGLDHASECVQYLACASRLSFSEVAQCGGQ